MLDAERLSRGLTKVLRHRAQQDGVAITADGWVRVAEALAWVNRSLQQSFDVEMVRAVVSANDKQRFALREGSDGVLEIRANQGHSMLGIAVDLVELTAESAPSFVVHGTYYKAWPSIRVNGLSKMARQHVHLARGLPGESGVISGMRASCELLIWVDVRRAIAAGVRFFESSNGVILTEATVLPEFFHEAIDRLRGAAIPLVQPEGQALAAEQ